MPDRPTQITRRKQPRPLDAGTDASNTTDETSDEQTEGGSSSDDAAPSDSNEPPDAAQEASGADANEPSTAADAASSTSDDDLGGTTTSDSDQPSTTTPTDAGEPTADASTDAALPDCSDCTPVSIVSDVDISDFTVLGPVVYYSYSSMVDDTPVSGPLMRVPVTGGTPSKVTLSDLPSGGNRLAAYGSHIFTAPNEVWTVPILGALEATELEGSPMYVTDLRVNSTHVFALWSLSQQYVTRVPQAGGTSNQPARTPNFDWVDFEVDEEYVYLLTETSLTRVLASGDDGGADAEVGPVAGSGELFEDLAVTETGGLVIATSTSLSAYTAWSEDRQPLYEQGVSQVVATTTHAYFFVSNSEDCTDGSELYEVALSGGRARKLATLDHCALAGSAAQDDERVYWLPSDATRILSALK